MTEPPLLPAARELLARHGLRPKKSWGQNFLTDDRVIDRIVTSAGITPDDVVVEIGAGLGALTGRLARTGAQVQAVERDPDLVPILTRELEPFPSVRIVAGDAMTFDLESAARAAGRPLVVLGNLPYQITTPLLFRIVAAGDAIARAVLMVQREVAERIVANPGGKIYGRLSVMVQAFAEVKIAFHVGAGSFLPQPNVTSSVFSLTPRAQPKVAAADRAMFAAVVRAAFAGRRKMLRRSLEAGFACPASEVLAAADIAGTRRAEELSVDEFAAIARAMRASGAPVPAAPLDEGEERDA